MLKLFPYNYYGGESAEENIKKSFFPYGLEGKKTGKELPLGLEIWPKLPKYIQKAFVNYFGEKQQMNIADWQYVFYRYKIDYCFVMGYNPNTNQYIIEKHI